MPARFEKTSGSFDGFDAKTVYQMVPLGDSRAGLNAVTGDEEGEVTFINPGVARFGGAKRFDPPSALPFSDTAVRLPPRTRFTFELIGLKPGDTTVVIRDRAGKALASLLVSVKAQIAKTYSLCRLSDMRRSCPWPAAELRPMMQRVEKTFLQQANVKLSEKGGVIHEVNINDRDLGDPLIPERIVQPENETLNFIILSRSPIQALASNFTIYFTWDLRATRKDIVGLNIGQSCYAEFNSTNPFENALTTAHELGHALGLDHTGADTLMAGDGNSRTSTLQQFEIDTINQTNLSP